MTGLQIALCVAAYFGIGILSAIINGVMSPHDPLPEENIPVILFWPVLLFFTIILGIWCGPCCWFSDGLQWAIGRARTIVGRHTNL